MGDERLRDLERRWRQTGAVEDEAAHLVERVRVGDLTRERLDLAAYCGHEGARRAGGLPRSTPGDLREWARGLDRWGTSTIVRAAIAAAHAGLESYEAVHDDPAPRACVELASRRMDGASAPQDHLELRAAMCDAAGRAEEASQPLVFSALAALDAAFTNDEILRRAGLEGVGDMDFSAAGRAVVAILALARGLGEERARRAVAAALVPRALGPQASPKTPTP